MKTVYQTTTVADAHVVLDLLQQSGMEARVLGQTVVYAHPLGNVRVVVAPANETAALEIISDWESARPEPTEYPPSRPTALSRAALMVLIGMGLVITVVWYFTRV